MPCNVIKTPSNQGHFSVGFTRDDRPAEKFRRSAVRAEFRKSGWTNTCRAGGRFLFQIFANRPASSKYPDQRWPRCQRHCFSSVPIKRLDNTVSFFAQFAHHAQIKKENDRLFPQQVARMRIGVKESIPPALEKQYPGINGSPGGPVDAGLFQFIDRSSADAIDTVHG